MQPLAIYVSVHCSLFIGQNPEQEINLFLFEFCAANKRVVIDFMENGKRPRFLADGMTIDTEGNLYVATFNGSKILKINPT